MKKGVLVKFEMKSDDREHMIKRLEQRVAAIELWLAEQGGGVIQEQRHLDVGAPERKYWHYGYMVALRDVIGILSGPTPSGHEGATENIPEA